MPEKNINTWKEVLGGCSRQSMSSSSTAFDAIFMLMTPNVVSLALTLLLKARLLSTARCHLHLDVCPLELDLTYSKLNFWFSHLIRIHIPPSLPYLPTPPKIHSIYHHILSILPLKYIPHLCTSLHFHGCHVFSPPITAIAS